MRRKGPASDPNHGPNLLAGLARRQLILVTGKGGVGKTSVAATLGKSLSQRGRKVLVLEIDPRENLHRMLGLPPSGGRIVEAGPGLFLQNLKRRQVLDEFVESRLKIELLTRRVLESPIYQEFAEGAPGLKEVAVLGHAMRQVRGGSQRWRGSFDTVVIDAPATGHGVSLLAAPGLLSEVIQKGPFGEMGRELAAFVSDPEGSAVVVVTLAEEMPVQEALELDEMLRERLSRSADLLVVNGLYPSVPARLRTSREPWAELWRHRRRIHEEELERLEREWRGPRVELPQFPVDSGPQLVEALVRCFERRMEARRQAQEVAAWS